MLLNHPQIELTAISSQSQKGKKIGEVHRDLAPILDTEFVEDLPLQDLDIYSFALAMVKPKSIWQVTRYQTICKLST